MSQEAYDEARRRIAEAHASGATTLSLAGRPPWVFGAETGFERLSALPPEIGRLTALRHLDLRDTPLSALPPEIGQLTALRVLYLRDTPLSALPPEIGWLGKLETLDLAGTPLRALPESLADLPDTVSLDVFDTRLADPPRRIVEAGVPAIRAYVAAKRRARAGSWVSTASRVSRHFGLPSRLAAVETGATVAAVVAAATVLQRPEPLWAAVALGPFLLLRTGASVRLAHADFAELLRRLRLKPPAGESGPPAWSLPFRQAALGLGSLLIKIAVTAYCVWKKPRAALRAMPRNLREQCLEIDLTAAPELLPGLERRYDRDERASYIVSDLWKRHDEVFPGLPWTRRLELRHAVAAPFLAVFFLLAAVYRLYVKAAALVYWPLLLIEVPDRRKLRRRTAPGAPASGRWAPLAVQAAVCGLALFGLAGLAGQPALQAAVEGWIDARLIRLWQALRVGDWLPQGVLWLLLLQALAYLGGAGAERMARGARVGDPQPSGLGRVGPVAERWMGLAQAAYLLHAGLIVALLASLFLAFAPNALVLAERLWGFLA
jgi:hypothetical protein